MIDVDRILSVGNNTSDLTFIELSVVNALRRQGATQALNCLDRAVEKIRRENEYVCRMDDDDNEYCAGLLYALKMIQEEFQNSILLNESVYKED